MEDLIREYRKSLRVLRSSKLVPLNRGSMISDTEWAIALMETGSIPGTKWTVARWSRDKREVLCDPLEMARYIRQQAPVEAAPEWMVNLLEEIMKSLTEKERSAYKLVRGQCYSFTQAAKLLNCSKSLIQCYVSRAERKIQVAVRGTEEGKKVGLLS